MVNKLLQYHHAIQKPEVYFLTEGIKLSSPKKKKKKRGKRQKKEGTKKKEKGK
jgi:hypothetical protein